MKAMLFYTDKGTFSEDVSEVDSGPPYVPPKLWNTYSQYENRSSSLLVTVEVAGEAGVSPERRLEFTATYAPLLGRSRRVVVRKVVTISIPIKAGAVEPDRFHAGFWLDNTGCNPVKLSARVIGSREITKRVIKFDCGE